MKQSLKLYLSIAGLLIGAFGWYFINFNPIPELICGIMAIALAITSKEAPESMLRYGIRVAGILFGVSDIIFAVFFLLLKLI